MYRLPDFRGAALLFFFCGYFFCGCLVPPRPMAGDPKQSAQTARAGDTIRARAASAEGANPLVPVRISALDGRDEVRVEHTQEGTQVFRRAGAGLVSTADGTAASVRLTPTSTGLGLAGNIYPGEILIEAHGALGLKVTNLVALEDYIGGVVPAELVLWSAAPAEIEAQAVASRTYALRTLAHRRALGKRAFLWDDTRDQVYRGRFSVGSSAAAQRVQARLAKAVADSSGKVLRHATGELFDVRFHATCGGHTAAPSEALPGESTLTGGATACEPCARIGAEERSWSMDDSRRRQVAWRWTASRRDLDALASSLDLGKHLLRLDVLDSDDHGRWRTVRLTGTRESRDISLARLRAELDPARLKSGHILRTWPAPGHALSGGLMFEGLGRGHGAGLCQVGSHELAHAGWSAAAILLHYLPAAQLSRSHLSAPTRLP